MEDTRPVGGPDDDYDRQIPSSSTADNQDEGSSTKYICTDCEKTFEHHSSLSRHKKSHSQNTTGSEYTCTTCFKSFGRKDNLLKHLNKGLCKSPYTVFRCDDCGKVFKRKFNLERHRAQHDKENRQVSKT